MDSKHHCKHKGMHLCFEIAKLTLKAGALVAACLAVNELHKVHKSIEERQKLAK